MAQLLTGDYLMEHVPLNKESAPPAALILQDPPALGIVHIGMGNFHRAHLAVHTAAAVAKAGGEWGIYGYSLRSNTLANQLANQDFLYTVLDIHPDSAKTIIPNIHVGALGGPESINQIIEIAAQPSVKIISLTITESGYCYSTQTGGLDQSRPEIIHDLANLDSPKSVIGLLSRILLTRAEQHQAPVAIASCDNLTSNGSTTKQVLLEFAALLPSSKRELLTQFIESSSSFPNSMVDRIVPSTEDRHIAMAAERLGVFDLAPVPAEMFSMWVLEDDFIAGRPAWERAGVIFSDEVDAYETMKLRLLNGSHSLLAYVGALLHKETIPDARHTPLIEEAVRKFTAAEMLPTFTMPTSIDFDSYLADLFSRWSNTVLSDKIARIGSDGSVKLPPRITQTTIARFASGSSAPLTALTIAAWVACMVSIPSFEPGEVAAAMKDPSLEYLRALGQADASPIAIIEKLFGEGKIFSAELGAIAPFKADVAFYLEKIINEGIESALVDALNK
jgi:fructuronate reductase